MGRPAKHQPSQNYTRVTARQIAAACGWSYERTRRWLAQNGATLGADRQGTPPTYDARIIEVIHALARRPHRPLDPGSDWLSDYTSGGST